MLTVSQLIACLEFERALGVGDPRSECRTPKPAEPAALKCNCGYEDGRPDFRHPETCPINPFWEP